CRFPCGRVRIPACAGMTIRVFLTIHRVVGWVVRWAVGWASAHRIHRIHQSHQFHRIKGLGE
ncbi:TPA: hypothetical protein ACFNMW_002087, partial [Neisseria lactamica]